MKPKIFYRKAHYWGSMIIAIPTMIVIITGILLMVKKEFHWIQPPTQQGVNQNSVPAQSFEQLFSRVKATPQMSVKDWSDLRRVEIKPGKGVAKFISASHWELQLDTQTGRILLLARRRSGLIESIHDGSWFASWAKLWLFFPAGVLLLGLWLTGIYLFLLPIIHRKKKNTPASSPVSQPNLEGGL